jgi:cell division protein FtsI/penicillin-binding protein 2
MLHAGKFRQPNTINGISMTRLLFFLLVFSIVGTPSLFSAVQKKQSRNSGKTVSTKKAAAVSRTLPKTFVARSKNRSSLKKTSARGTYRKKYRRRAKNRFVASGPWLVPTYADSTLGDRVDGEDLTVRRAAVEALGPYNGTVVVADPLTGRILTIVNQKTAFKSGFQPCSTIKIVAAMAGLSEGVIDRNTSMRLYRRRYMNLTDALATSNNPYFANLGVKLGFEKVTYYAKLMGLGEKAGWDIPEEEAGTLPVAPPAHGGTGMMMSFGEGIKLNPLQLTAMLSALANGGTLYYLQYPRTQAEAEELVPRVKRELDIETLIPELKPGLAGAVEWGTARRASYDPSEPIFGKTGTCTDRETPTHLGWFGSFNDIGARKLVVVVLLTGGRPVNGPVASGIAGAIYRSLSEQKFFAGTESLPPVALVSGSGL